MGNKLVLLFILAIFGCGKNVSISHSKLKDQSAILANNQTQLQDGILYRTQAENRIATSGSNYKVSTYSSYLALEFIAAKSLGSQTQVSYRGTVKNNELVLEVILQK